MKAHGPQLRDLNEWYRQNIEKLNIKTHVLYETKPMAGVLVVDWELLEPLRLKPLKGQGQKQMLISQKQ
ncbi:MAG: hypothetical protein O4861_14450 [Trichodesmium sp. St16_bin4-tuft]|nr:hypothetical protein [Trichodesmium sp. St5_bin8]MDE5077309.1 hypothetical protein [Trichodesmium sp. St2_bin6]MDE5099463.1 hypothetical protein [Trichodesmium sp. St16_bin4-tuft]MDE5101739.1 hypothetical protein [Trichodesmium sp. St19_bin2]